MILKISFNPCFSGLFPQTILSGFGFKPEWSFNPCFSGLFPQTNWIFKLFEGIKGVSILVLVDCSLKLEGIKGKRNFHHNVSILVLVDCSLKPEAYVVDTFITACFNPCFSGLFPQTKTMSNQKNQSNQCFNPCFSGLFPQTKRLLVIRANLSLFQSLF